MPTYEIRPRRDHRGVAPISDALPFGRLWYAEPNVRGAATPKNDRPKRLGPENFNQQLWWAVGTLANVEFTSQS
jgi:hypothetical protein